MKPTQQFIQMIAGFLPNQPKIITRNDIIKHNTRDITYYSVCQGNFINNVLKSQTAVFSDQILIDIQKGANKVIIGTDLSETVYTRTSPIEFDNADGKGFLCWNAVDKIGKSYIIAKMLAEDRSIQIKIISPSGFDYSVHNVCELPAR